METQEIWIFMYWVSDFLCLRYDSFKFKPWLSSLFYPLCWCDLLHKKKCTNTYRNIRNKLNRSSSTIIIVTACSYKLKKTTAFNTIKEKVITNPVCDFFSFPFVSTHAVFAVLQFCLTWECLNLTLIKMNKMENEQFYLKINVVVNEVNINTDPYKSFWHLIKFSYLTLIIR